VAVTEKRKGKKIRGSGKGKGRATTQDVDSSESEGFAVEESSETSTSSEETQHFVNPNTGRLLITRQFSVDRLIQLESLPLYYPPQVDVLAHAFHIKVTEDEVLTEGLAAGDVSMNILAKNMVSQALSDLNCN